VDKQTKISVQAAMDGTTAVSGTKDGGKLARWAVAALENSEKVLLDFDGIIAMSYSAACAFWAVLANKFGSNVVSRTAFVNLGPQVIESLEHGLDCASNSGMSSSSR
jgi:hypothetical protein